MDAIQEFNYVRPLEAGKSCTWWESGQVKEPGHYRLHAVLDALGLETPAISVEISVSKPTDDQASREAGLQKQFESIPILAPNLGEAEGTYHWIGFTNDPVVVDGELYHGFRFKAPRQPAVFDWSCIQNLERSGMSWYIVPKAGKMKGFTQIDRSRTGAPGVPGLTRSGDQTIFQELPAENFEPGSEYLIWFKATHGLPTGVMVSLNFTASEIVDYRATPAAIDERKRFDRVESQP
jgi:hypothetical protein